MSANQWNHIETAEYIEHELPEYADNPFICALPKINSHKEALNVLTLNPVIRDSEVLIDQSSRVHAIQRLTSSFFLPFSSHLVLESKFSKLIRQGYIGRNPSNGDFFRHLNAGYDRIQEADINKQPVQKVNSTARSFAIVGISGCGKSLAIDRILSSYKEAIYHPEFHIVQVPWIKLECPHKGSLGELCRSFFTALDNRLGTQYRKKYGKARVGIDELITEMAQVANLHAIGVIVVDEIQKLSWQKSGGAEAMLSFFTSLVNQVGVPVVLVGTPRAREIFIKDFSIARRTTGMGAVYWNQMDNDQNWHLLVNTIWKYQWLRKKEPLTVELIDYLYSLSQGVFDILIKLYMLSQCRAMLVGTECISMPLIKKVYEDELKPVHLMLDALRSKDPDKIARYGDLRMPEIESRLIEIFADEARYEQILAVPIISSDQPSKVKAIVDIAVQMGMEFDIAVPLVEMEIQNNPNLDVMHIIHKITSTFVNKPIEPKAIKIKKTSKKTNINHWLSYGLEDMRRVYADKDNNTMHAALSNRGIVCDIDSIVRLA